MSIITSIHMTTARQKILAYLSKSRNASAREISRSLQMNSAAVRHHLRVLVADGRLELTALRVRRHDGKGRPENIYSLPKVTLGHNLAGLADALLDEAGSGVRMEALAGHLARRLAAETDVAGPPLAKRLNLTVAKLNQMSYHAHWEAGSEGPRIIFGHCPYAAIVGKHPELCAMDRALLKDLTSQSATQIFKTGKDGSSVCVFVVGK